MNVSEIAYHSAATVVNMQLIVGLGNPGPKYEHTRHNIGFDIAEAIAERTRLRLSAPASTRTGLSKLTSWMRRQDLAMAGKSRHGGNDFTLVKPLTHMNRSGEAVAHYVRALQLDHQDVLVMFDDISLPVGVVRLRKKGGAGGHNGMQDIIDRLGTSEFPRLRFGVGSEFERGEQIDYVLSPFAACELEAVEAAITQATDAVLTFIREGIDIAMNKFNRRG